MADPLVQLVPVLKSAVISAFGAEYAETDPMIRPSKFADYQVNLAMGLAKTLGQKPRDIATAIVKHLETGALIERAEIAGPGFINLWLSSKHLDVELMKVLGGELGLESAVKGTIVVDYSSPNVAKEMHVGHLRSTIIGDALARVFEAQGHRVIRQNHLGDWGTPFGMLIEHLLDGGAEAAEHSVADLNGFYQAARKKFDDDENFAERARQRVVLLQGGEAQTLDLWKRLVQASTKYFGHVYSLLGITLTEGDIAGESFYNSLLPGVVKELSEQGLAVESDGAICVFPPGFTGRDEQPVPLIIRKQDGGYGYATTDLAAVRHRVSTLLATRILYVVGAPQAQHLEMVFAASKLAGWLPESVRAEHVAFGAVLGADKKMFRTRAGETIRLVDLLKEAVTRAGNVVREKNPVLEQEVQDNIARAIGIGAVKYADLSSDRNKDYVFDWDRMLSFEGNTAPYLQYAHARVSSIFRRAEDDLSQASICISAPEEKLLALCLLSFPTVVSEVADSLLPHKLCGYLYDLATTYSAFYEKCPVLRAESAELRASRLLLCRLSAEILRKGLSLLGIEAPERM
jgi:arginyl-tRNA synthetase